MPPLVQAFFDPATSTVSYIVSDPQSRQAAIVDPVLDFDPKAARITTTSADRLLAHIADQGLALTYVLETHAHADHLSAAELIRERTGAKIVIGAHITDVQKTFGPLFDAEDVRADGSAFDYLIDEGQTLPLGELDISVLHTPGHTPACVTYRIGDAAFVGDTLFMPDYGTARADFPGGDAAVLYRSIRKILDLPPETRIFVGHDYQPAGREPAWETTVAAEREGNVHVHDSVGEAEFVAMREARDATLAAPTLILPSLQVNIRAGALPPAEPSGRVFLRLPVNAI
ncbi:MBL fold metallo-hydrolase [Caulobacter sp. NIBR2454]|uniref:MBL fold metallo-hydrolase n=1 Tax=Caulobacter sp. NIBR2454 TaxID=3015996 RepID=UPI0022B65ED8|nr:MBL fold metallo-hydrolase [Caulobacter sp. NIBR2454]